MAMYCMARENDFGAVLQLGANMDHLFEIQAKEKEHLKDYSEADYSD